MAQKLSVQIIGEATSAKAAFHETASSGEEAESRLSRTGERLGDTFKETFKTFVPLAAGLGAAEFAKGAIEGAENLRKAQDGLAVAIKHTGGNAAALIPQYNAAAKGAADFGINQTDATKALERATLITGHAKDAMRGYKEAVVISKATGKDLNAVLLATSKAQEGNVGALKRYGVVLDKNATGQEQMNTVMGRFGGQAEANTSASDKLSAHFQNLQTKIGTLLLPAFDAIVSGIDKATQFLMSPAVTGAFDDFAKTITGALQPAIDWVRANWPEIKAVIVTTVQDTWTVVKGIIDLFKAGWQEFGGTIKTIVKNDLGAVKDEFMSVVQVIRGIVEIVKGIAHGDWQQVWDGIKNVVVGVMNAILALPKALAGDLAAAFSKLGGIILNALAAGFRAAKHLLEEALDAAIIDPINAVINLIDSVHIHIPKVHIPGIGDIGGGDIGINVPTIPRLDLGGVVAKTGLAVVHQGEVFSGVGPQARGLGGGGYTFVFNGFVGSERQVIDAIHGALLRKKQTGAALGLA